MKSGGKNKSGGKSKSGGKEKSGGKKKGARRGEGIRTDAQKRSDNKYYALYVPSYMIRLIDSHQISETRKGSVLAIKQNARGISKLSLRMIVRADVLYLAGNCGSSRHFAFLHPAHKLMIPMDPMILMDPLRHLVDLNVSDVLRHHIQIPQTDNHCLSTTATTAMTKIARTQIAC